MFDGARFLEVAKSLAIPQSGHPLPTDAAQRTAVGRAYYACFHVLRPRVCDPKGWSRVESGGKKKYLTHRQLRSLVAKKLPEGAVDLLDSLVELREHADYHIWRPSSGTLGPPPSCVCQNWSENLDDNSTLAIRTAEILLAMVPPGTGVLPNK
jgi:hypothetical protein